VHVIKIKYFMIELVQQINGFVFSLLVTLTKHGYIAR